MKWQFVKKAIIQWQLQFMCGSNFYETDIIITKPVFPQFRSLFMLQKYISTIMVQFLKWIGIFDQALCLVVYIFYFVRYIPTLLKHYWGKPTSRIVFRKTNKEVCTKFLAQLTFTTFVEMSNLSSLLFVTL